jgi:hypothetical protein
MVLVTVGGQADGSKVMLSVTGAVWESTITPSAVI